MTEVKNEKMNRVTVHLDEKPIYDIVMTEDFSALPGEIEKLSISNRRLCIVTDSNVEKLYLNEVKELLAPLQDGNRSYFRRARSTKPLTPSAGIYMKP